MNSLCQKSILLLFLIYFLYTYLSSVAQSTCETEKNSKESGHCKDPHKTGPCLVLPMHIYEDQKNSFEFLSDQIKCKLNSGKEDENAFPGQFSCDANGNPKIDTILCTNADVIAKEPLDEAKKKIDDFLVDVKKAYEKSDACDRDHVKDVNGCLHSKGDYRQPKGDPANASNQPKIEFKRNPIYLVDYSGNNLEKGRCQRKVTVEPGARIERWGPWITP